VGKRELTLKTFTIDDQNNITVFDTQAEAAATTIRAESQCRGTTLFRRLRAEKVAPLGQHPRVAVGLAQALR
jgi:hypothetical protein